MKSLVLRLVKVMAGLFLLSAAIVLTCQAGLGIAPWDVLSQGMSVLTQGTAVAMTMGQASIASGAVIILVDLLARERIGVGTILNLIFIGTFIDLINVWNQKIGLVPMASGLWDGLALLVLSFPVMALGMYLYMSPKLGAGPRDSLMVAVKRRAPYPVGVCRMVIEAVVLVVGWLMGGTVGIGTVLLVLGNGPAMQWCFTLFRFDVEAAPNDGITDTLRQIGARLHKKTAPQVQEK